VGAANPPKALPGSFARLQDSKAQSLTALNLTNCAVAVDSLERISELNDYRS